MTIFSPPKFLKTGVMFALTLVRHGETLHNKDNVIQGQLDVPLSTIGLEQAELLGKHLQQQRFTHVYSSDLSRAKQTAQSILEKNQVTPGPIVEDQRLRERKFGTVEGRSFGYLKEASNKANQSVSSYTPPGAETLDQVRKRAVAFFDDLCQLLRGSYPTEDQENLSPSKRKREEQSPSLPSSLSSSPSSFPPPYNSPSSTAPPFADELIRAALSPSADESSVAAAADPAPNVSLSAHRAVAIGRRQQPAAEAFSLQFIGRRRRCRRRRAFGERPRSQPWCTPARDGAAPRRRPRLLRAGWSQPGDAHQPQCGDIQVHCVGTARKAAHCLPLDSRPAAPNGRQRLPHRERSGGNTAEAGGADSWLVRGCNGTVIRQRRWI
ncbi:hypothetical protein MRX96_042887 [Rhipicephalus microplus]